MEHHLLSKRTRNACRVVAKGPNLSRTILPYNGSIHDRHNVFARVTRLRVRLPQWHTCAVLHSQLQPLSLYRVSMLLRSEKEIPVDMGSTKEDRSRMEGDLIQYEVEEKEKKEKRNRKALSTFLPFVLQ